MIDNKCFGANVQRRSFGAVIFFPLIFAICLLPTAQNHAQTANVPLTVSSILTPKGVYIYSYVAGKAETKGFKLQAYDASGKLRLEREILPDANPADLKALGKAYELEKEQIKYYKDMYSELSKDNRTFLYSLYDFVFGAMAGYSYLDDGVKDGENYRYVITDIASGQSRELKVKFALPKQFKIALVKIGPLIRASYIEWDRIPHDDVIGYNVYMSYQKNKDFKKLNERPIVVPERFNNKKVKSGSYTHDLPKEYAGTPMFYKVECLYAGGIAGGESEVREILPMKEALYPPAILNIEKDKDGLSQLYWKPAGDPTQYLTFNIYLAFGKEGNYVKYNKTPVAGQQYKTVLKLDRRGTYFVRMTAVHKNGAESEKSGFFNYFFDPGVASDLVTNLQLTPKPGAMALSWQGVPNCIDYWIYRSYGKFQEPAHVATVAGTKTQYLDKDLNSDITYWYTVRALQRNKNEGLMHAPVAAKPLLNASTKKIHAIRGKLNNSTAIIEWSRSDVPNVIGYNIYLKKGPKSAQKTRLNKEPVTAVMFEYDLTDPGAYDFVVAAVEQRGGEVAFSDSIMLKYDQSKIPSPTIRLISLAKGAGVLVQWNGILSDSLGRYHIYRKEARERKFRKVGSAKSTDDSFVDATVRKKMQYTYYLVSVDKNGIESFPGAERIIILK